MPDIELTYGLAAWAVTPGDPKALPRPVIVLGVEDGVVALLAGTKTERPNSLVVEPGTRLAAPWEVGGLKLIWRTHFVFVVVRVPIEGVTARGRGVFGKVLAQFEERSEALQLLLKR